MGRQKVPSMMFTGDLLSSYFVVSFDTFEAPSALDATSAGDNMYTDIH